MRTRFVLGCVGLFGLGIIGCSAGEESDATARPVEALDPGTARKIAGASVPPPAAVKAANDRYIVVFKKGVSLRGVRGLTAADVATRIGQAHGATVRRRYQHALEGMAVQVSAAALAGLKADPEVDYVVEDTEIILHDVTWGKDRVDQRALPLNQIVNSPNQGQGVHAYIIDTGIRATHSEFQGGPSGSRIGVGIDLFNDDNTPEDERGHGTHVAATVGGTRYGVANQVTIHPVKVFGAQEGTDASMLIEAIDWVTARKLESPTVPAVANMSIGGGLNNALNAALENSVAQGVTYAVSAGNNGEGPISLANACNGSPGSAPSAITVGATNLFDARAPFSSYGSCVDVFAPGQRVLSAVHTGDNDTTRFDGTSMSSPHVAGVAALYLSANPTATPVQVTNAIVGKATRGIVTDMRPNSANRLLYMGNLVATGGDTQAPTAQITAPAANAVLSGLVNVTANATDNAGVTGVELFVNGLFESDDFTAPYSLPWNTQPLANGFYDLTVRAYDNAGNTTTSSTVRVQYVRETTPPAVAITAPTSGASVGALTTLRATATDASGVRFVRFSVDFQEIGTAITPVSGNTYEVSWDSRSVAPGAHGIIAVATDGVGTSAVSPTVNFNVFTDTVLPAAAITAPAANANVSGTVTYTATASDDRNVITEVNFLVGETVVCTDTSSPYTCSWNARPEGNGSATLRVKATDRFGNVGTSATRTVNVQSSPAAAFNATLQAPACMTTGSSCSSRNLTAGQLSTELNQPNTLADSCADGASLGRYRLEESLERLYIATVDGTNLAPGKSVVVETKAYLLGEADFVDLYYAPNANSPVWTYITTLNRTGSVHDIVTLSTQFNLPAGGTSLQAIRANLRVYGAPSPCTPGNLNDRDDLAFAVATPAQPCGGLCTNPIVFSSLGYGSGNLGTGATCHETTTSPTHVNCGNFATGRTFRINDQLVTCNFQNQPLASIPKRNGGYCYQATAGNHPWAYFSTF